MSVTLSLASSDYLALRRQQLGTEVPEAEVRAIHGFVGYILSVAALKKKPAHSESEAVRLAELVQG